MIRVVVIPSAKVEQNCFKCRLGISDLLCSDGGARLPEWWLKVAEWWLGRPPPTSVGTSLQTYIMETDLSTKGPD